MGAKDVIRKRAIATVCMLGALAEKLGAAAEAGYQGVEIFENDLTYFDGRPEDVRGLAGSLGLEIVALQPTQRLIARVLDALQALLAALADRDQLGLDLPAALDREADGIGLRACGHCSVHVSRSGVRDVIGWVAPKSAAASDLRLFADQQSGDSRWLVPLFILQGTPVLARSALPLPRHAPDHITHIVRHQHGAIGADRDPYWPSIGHPFVRCEETR